MDHDLIKGAEPRYLTVHMSIAEEEAKTALQTTLPFQRPADHESVLKTSKL